MNHKELLFLFSAIVVCAAVALGFCAHNERKLRDEIKNLKTQAVKRGHAKWAVDENGVTTWQWKEND